ncbi:TPA: hypothetical protein ACTXXA_002197 [Legionella anisa]
MVYFKSIINGIGTGGGVAWPLFGIVFSVVGTSIGSLVSFALGGVSIALFLMTSTAIFYLSYQKAQEEEQRTQTLLQKNEQKLLEFVNEYIYKIHKSYQLTAKTIPFKAFLCSHLEQQLSTIAKDEKKTPLYQALKFIKILIEQQLLKEKSILPIIERKIIPQYSVPYSNMIVPIFYAFVGTFGSIAGCSAGISGLLTGLGLFSSFAAFPILGWGILGFAISMGIFAANNAISATRETSKNELLNQTIKKMYQHLKSQVLDLPLNLFHNPSNPTTNKSSRNFPSLFLSEDESVINSWVSTSDALQRPL